MKHPPSKMNEVHIWGRNRGIFSWKIALEKLKWRSGEWKKGLEEKERMTACIETGKSKKLLSLILLHYEWEHKNCISRPGTKDDDLHRVTPTIFFLFLHFNKAEVSSSFKACLFLFWNYEIFSSFILSLFHNIYTSKKIIGQGEKIPSTQVNMKSKIHLCFPIAPVEEKQKQGREYGHV